MRVAVVLFGLALVAVARAEDDDGVLDTHPLGEPIPERLQALEREWAEDVGTKEPVEDPANAAEEPKEPSPFEDDAEVEAKPHAPADEPVARSKAKTTPTARTEAIDRAAAAGDHRVGPASKAAAPQAPGAAKPAAPEPTSPED